MIEAIVLDCETNGLLDVVDRLHVVSYTVCVDYDVVEARSIFSVEEFQDLFNRYPNAMVVCHNLMRYDRKVFINLLEIEIPIEKCFDSLAVSYYLYPYRDKHGLESWGETIGIPKPVIEDWENQTREDYSNRCEQDVNINTNIYFHFLSYLLEIYGSWELLLPFIQYLSFKMDSLADQEDPFTGGIKLNKSLAKKHAETLENMLEAKKELLISIMPPDVGTVLKKIPKNLFKANGNLSVAGENWFRLLEEKGLPADTEVVYEKPNPSSNTQLKKWLFSLGWVPMTFKESKVTKEKVPQISLPFGQGICDSVKALYDTEPNLIELEGYFQIQHRLGLFKGFLECEKYGLVFASASGLTNTLRLTHSKPCVNMPKPGVFFGKEVREVLEVYDDSYIMIGADISGLEDNTKQHYIFPYDPQYVIDMRVPGFDPHIDIGVLANMITHEEAEFFRMCEAMSDEEKANMSAEDKALLKSIKKKRGSAKVGNFAMTYNAFPPKIKEIAKFDTLEEAENLYNTYWERNHAIKKVAESALVKKVRNRNWIYNPLSGFWLFLKAEKDKFSTLNQSSGVFVFDCWLRFVRQDLKQYGISVVFQYHDELMIICKKEYKEIVADILRNSMVKVNSLLQLNVEITISIDYGRNYAEVH